MAGRFSPAASAFLSTLNQLPVSVFEAFGAHANKQIGDAELQAIESHLAAMN